MMALHSSVVDIFAAKSDNRDGVAISLEIHEKNPDGMMNIITLFFTTKDFIELFNEFADRIEITDEYLKIKERGTVDD